MNLDLIKMHKTIALFSLAGAMICGYQITCPTISAGFYQIEFSGKAGEKMIGTYTLTDPLGEKPMRVEKVEGTLPQSISFSSPEGYQVSASAIQISGEEAMEITTTIVKDGTDCTRPILQGSGGVNMVICQP
jgi:hypothetical protein